MKGANATDLLHYCQTQALSNGVRAFRQQVIDPQQSKIPFSLLSNHSFQVRYQLATLGLGPLVFLQGHRVRRRIPRLPEADGRRSGVAGKGPRLKLLIAGDSAAAGVGVSTQKDALAGHLVAHLGCNYRVHWKIIARTGHTAGDVFEHLQSVASGSFDVAFLSVGVNDVTHRTDSSSWIKHQQQIIALLKTKFSVRHVLYSSLPPMHRFQVLPQPLRWYVGLRARELNRMLVRVTQVDDRCEVVKIRIPTLAPYFAADGFHPSAPAYSLWGRQAAAAIERRLALGGQ